MERALDQIEQGIIDLIANLPAILIALTVFWVLWIASDRVRNFTLTGLERTGRSHSISLLLARLSRITVITLGGLLALTIALPSFNPGQFIELLGITSIAIGFAFRDILQNFLAGVLLLLTEPFKIGDQIIVDNYEGTVEEIEMRATTVRTYDNRRIVIPNSSLFTESVTVNTAYNYRRSQYDVGIGYEDNIEAAQKLMLEVMKSADGVLENPKPDTIMMEMGDSAVVIRVRWWTDPRIASVLRVQNLVLRRIKNQLTEEGFNIPFPIRTVYLESETENTTVATPVK